MAQRLVRIPVWTEKAILGEAVSLYNLSYQSMNSIRACLSSLLCLTLMEVINKCGSKNTGATYFGRPVLALCNVIQDTIVISTSQTTVWDVKKRGRSDSVGTTLPARAFTTIESGWLLARKRCGLQVGIKSVPSGFRVVQTWPWGGYVLA